MLVALIREAECVGCAKCLPACPVDAIIGSSKFLHNVLIDECIGCGLCVAPCPMDCIEMVESGIVNGSEQKERRAHRAKQRYHARQKRLALNEAPKLLAPFDEKTKVKIQQEIKASILRSTEKREQNERYKKA